MYRAAGLSHVSIVVKHGPADPQQIETEFVQGRYQEPTVVREYPPADETMSYGHRGDKTGKQEDHVRHQEIPKMWKSCWNIKPGDHNYEKADFLRLEKYQYAMPPPGAASP